MAFKVHQIQSYNYSFDARVGGPGRLQLWGQGPTTIPVANVTFVEDTSPVPEPILSSDLNSATVSFKQGALPGLIDMLRNAHQVRVTINDQSPGFVFIHTEQESAGKENS
ncbi:hypothetical protein [Dictyobacter aurantiacus]|uniref:Uncharacterized protein n=1 Tax=Dictyobacter aurantiacus TaxID=1936993 RepID=A0A401ZMM7_9CHLR|nr:hypothetical protein [Dictyobacter aurantiacus]GCE08115.1 hypothetical protein KDAU_54440 [Dictyobacter aurantiacus]